MKPESRALFLLIFVFIFRANCSAQELLRLTPTSGAYTGVEANSIFAEAIRTYLLPGYPDTRDPQFAIVGDMNTRDACWSFVVSVNDSAAKAIFREGNWWRINGESKIIISKLEEVEFDKNEAYKFYNYLRQSIYESRHIDYGRFSGGPICYFSVGVSGLTWDAQTPHDDVVPSVKFARYLRSLISQKKTITFDDVIAHYK